MCLWRPSLSEALPGEFDAIGIVDQTIEHSVCDGRIANDLIPAVNGHLTGDEGGTAFVTVLDNFEEIATLAVVKLLRSPIVDDQEINAGEGFQHPFMPPIPARKSEGPEQSRSTMIGDGEVITTGFVPNRTGKPGTGRTRRDPASSITTLNILKGERRTPPRQSITEREFVAQLVTVESSLAAASKWVKSMYLLLRKKTNASIGVLDIGVQTPLTKFATSLQRDLSAIKNALATLWTTRPI